mmetsp:Transcript_36059/g.76894  ORF Transcript_36059/g.76894 Transcript_36059/m.76894 type:complete len:211 (-) Transcript_36059:53-685(-)
MSICRYHAGAKIAMRVPEGDLSMHDPAFLLRCFLLPRHVQFAVTVVALPIRLPDDRHDTVPFSWQKRRIDARMLLVVVVGGVGTDPFSASVTDRETTVGFQIKAQLSPIPNALDGRVTSVSFFSFRYVRGEHPNLHGCPVGRLRNAYRVASPGMRSVPNGLMPSFELTRREPFRGIFLDASRSTWVWIGADASRQFGRYDAIVTTVGGAR